MSAPATRARLQIIAPELERHEDDFADAVLAGLQAKPKTLPCRFFYDARGSRLFEDICELDEYYPTRTEQAILDRCASALAARFPERATIVELGSGSSSKTRVLIEAFLRQHGALRYVPVDISRSMLEESAHSLLDDYPGLEILAIAAEYDHGLHRLKSHESEAKLILWLGSSIGNLSHADATVFLGRVRRAMSEGDRLLVGMDLQKERGTLERAYDDGAGVTARFNKNILARINRELGGNFDLRRFEHRAHYAEDPGRIEMRLVSTCAQSIDIAGLEVTIEFEAGESIHTESSHKYSQEQIVALADEAGLRIDHQWLDDDSFFSVNLLAPACSS